MIQTQRILVQMPCVISAWHLNWISISKKYKNQNYCIIIKTKYIIKLFYLIFSKAVYHRYISNYKKKAYERTKVKKKGGIYVYVLLLPIQVKHDQKGLEQRDQVPYDCMQ